MDQFKCLSRASLFGFSTCQKGSRRWDPLCFIKCSRENLGTFPRKIAAGAVAEDRKRTWPKVKRFARYSIRKYQFMSLAKDMNKMNSGSWLNPDRVIVDQMLGCDQRLMLATQFINLGTSNQHAMLLRN